MLRYAATFRELPRVLEILHKRGEKVIVDYAKENCKLRDAFEVMRTTEGVIKTLPPDSMCAIKLTSFGSRESKSKAKDYAHSIIKTAKQHGVKVCIDAEDVLYPDICYDLMTEHNTRTDVHVYKTYQMYRTSAMQELMCDMNDTDKAAVDNEYAKAMTHSLVCPHVHTILATHNERSLRYATRFDKEQYVTAQLLGMGKNIGVDYRYVPFGNLVELTPYLIRRLRERMSWN